MITTTSFVIANAPITPSKLNDRSEEHTSADGRIGFFFLQQSGEPVHAHVHEHADDARDERGQLALLRHEAHAAEHGEQGEQDGEAFRAVLADLFFDPAQPMEFLFFVEQEVEEDQQQERAAERGHFGVARRQVARVLGRTVDRHVPDVDEAQPRRHRHDQQGKQQPHAEHGDDDAHREEQLLPECVPVAQDGGVDDRVVERERDLQHAQHGRDPQALHESSGAAVGKAPPAGQRQQDGGDHERQPEMLHVQLLID